jgi:tungstate transport system substrate-binding protein
MLRRLMTVVGATAVLAGWGAGAAAADAIRVQSTTDTVDAGLVDGLLRPAYAQAQPGDTLEYTAVGTGKALDNARAGLADVVITHAPSLEAQFVADGYSADPFGRQIFFSDYVLIGPRSDPAGVLAAHSHDAIGALEDIAAAGEEGNASFVSRGDNSGTNVQEQIMWGLTSTVTKQTASNAGGAADRFEPGSGGTVPKWYVRTTKGQAANVQEADVCPSGTYPNGNCYTMVDRGTFNRLVNAGTVTNLAIVAQQNDPAARAGQNLLINPFSVYVLNPGKFADPGKPNVTAARRFVDFLVSPGFQQALASFPTAVDPAFRPDAFPAVTLDAPLPASTSARSLRVAGTVANVLPGAAPVSGMALKVQQSIDGGTTWTDVGQPAPTDATGRFSASIPVVRTAAFRLSAPATATTAYNGLTALDTPLGTVEETRKPTVSAIALKRRRLSLTVSEAGVVRVVLLRRVQTGGAVRLRAVKRLVFRPSGRARVSRSFRALAPGRYRVAVGARDLSGNRRLSSVVRSVPKP